MTQLNVLAPSNSYVSTVRRSPVKPKRKSVALRTVELCAGAGGAALGLERAGFTHSALIEIDPHACATLRTNRPYWNVIEADIKRFDASYFENVDLLSGGLPCPPFSIAGKQLGSDDERDMFPSLLRIASILRPRAILIENVRGLLTPRFDLFRGEIAECLDKQGFDTYWHLLNAVDFGVPQQRFRAFMVALRRGEANPLQWPRPLSQPQVTVGEAIGDLMASGDWAEAQKWREGANAPAPTIVGGSHKHGGPDLGPTRARARWAALGVDGSGLTAEPPGPDFTGKPRLTLRMVAKLQGFPNDWVFVGPKTHAYRQIGNALPVNLSYAIAKAVKSCLES